VHHITPTTIRKAIRDTLSQQIAASKTAREAIAASEDEMFSIETVAELEQEMLAAADALEFERAARLRDRIEELKARSPAKA
jgi:excinuclease ABC subunit B